MRTVKHDAIVVAGLLAVLLGIARPYSSAQAPEPTRRALIIGIDKYHYPDRSAEWRAAAEKEWGARLTGGAAGGTTVERRAEVPDLLAPVNDARAVDQMLRVRFGYSDVTRLEDSAATRDGILSSIHALIARSQPGDIVVFYFAGHGSQQVNSLAPPSATAARLDQTIVPADANIGQFDIRNVELNQRFDSLLSKNVKLTLIFDSCHSGSAVRGLALPGRYRLASFDNRDAADPADLLPIASPRRPNPALFLAAAHEFQLAAEDSAVDPVDMQLHGTFTRALLDVLRSGGFNPNVPAREVFKQIEAVMRWRGATQVPVLQGDEVDPGRPLLGPVVGPRAAHVTLAFQGMRDGTVILDGGAVAGLGEGSELFAPAVRDTVRIRITAKSTLTTSEAAVVRGDAATLAPGTLFMLDAARVSSAMPLHAWIPNAISSSSLKTARTAFARLRASKEIEWVDDPTSLPDDGTPLYVVRYDGARWTVKSPSGASLPLTGTTADAVLVAVRSDLARNSKDVSVGARTRARLFVLIPPTTELRGALTSPDAAHSIIASQVPIADSYALFGQLRSDGGVSYAWVFPNATVLSQRISPYPPRTDWVPGALPADSTPARLIELAYRLGRISYWLTVDPKDGGIFNYELGLRGDDPGHEVFKFLGDSTPIVGGESYSMVLRKPSTDRRVGEQRYVYVFSIDSHGEGALLFGESRNQLPATDAENRILADTLIALPQSSFTMCDPYGVDSYIMIASSEAIPNPSETFQLDPVLARGPHPNPPPVLWSVRRLAIRSVAPPKGSKLEQQARDSCKR